METSKKAQKGFINNLQSITNAENTHHFQNQQQEHYPLKLIDSTQYFQNNSFKSQIRTVLSRDLEITLLP